MVEARVDVDPKGELRKTFQEIGNKVSDLTIPMGLITQSWFKTNRAIFSLKSAGKYVDLTEKYKKFKIRHLGSAYPILKLSGQLEASITEPTDGYAVHYMINKLSLALGTRVVSKDGAPYGYFLHHGTKKMPARPVVLFGAEQVAPSGLNKRVEAWRKILLDYVVKVSKQQHG